MDAHAGDRAAGRRWLRAIELEPRLVGAYVQLSNLYAALGKDDEALARMVSETFGVPSVTIWLLDETQERLALGGSTVFSEAQARGLTIARKGAPDLIRAMRDRQMPVDFDAPPDAQAKGLREFHVDYFGEACIRYGVPLVAGREFLGFMTLDERLTKEPLSVEDVDLLKTLTDQAAGSLLNLKLSERLMRAKEMEAFQTLSAFLLHDLKNLASTLSRMLQNLPTYYDHPAFRNDMLRAISQSVARMNAMCSRLSPLSQRLELQRTEVGLNELVTATLAGLNGRLKASLIQDLCPVPRLAMDPEQMQKVLINLSLFYLR